MERYAGYVNISYCDIFITIAHVHARNKKNRGQKREDESKQNLLNGFPSDLGHDSALSSQVLITKAQEVVDDKGCGVSHTHNKNVTGFSG